MSDNVTITKNANATPPDGTIIATDEVSGVQYQIMKLAVGGDGQAALVDGDNRVPVSSDAEAPLSRGEIERKLLLEQMLVQLRIMNMHLASITDETFDISDLEELLI